MSLHIHLCFEVSETLKTKFVLKVHYKVKSLSHVRLFATPRTAACQATPSMGFFQAGVLEWVAISFFKGSSSDQLASLITRTTALSK